MDKKRAIELLRQWLDEIPDLKEKRYDNQDFKLWVSKLMDTIKASLDKDDYEKFSDAWPHYGLYADAPQNQHQERYHEEISLRETAIKEIIQKYEILGIEEQPGIITQPKPGIIKFPTPGKRYQTREAEKESTGLEEKPIHIFNAMQFHPKVVEASRSLFVSKHYDQAILEAFKAVENFVKEKSGSNLYGKQLMATVFNEDKPIIQVLEAGHFDKDVQEGFKFLFMGATVGIRNVKAHKMSVQKDPYITLEYLGFASFLLKRISSWEAGTT